MYNFNMCTCSMEGDCHTPEYYRHRLIEEWHELVSGPCVDELADVMLLASLWVYSVTGVGLVLPYAGLSLKKGAIRVELHGCVRSYRNRCSE